MSIGPNVIGSSRIEQETALQSMIAGLTQYESQLPSMVVDGKSYSSSDLVSILKARLEALKAVDTARAVWRNTVKDDYAQRANTAVLLSGARQAVLVAFSSQIDTLATFGLVPRKKAVVAPEVRVVAAKKAQATRIARHTMGPKQKAAIKGDVTGVEVTPMTAPATPLVAPPVLVPAPAPGTVTPSVDTAAKGP